MIINPTDILLRQRVIRESNFQFFTDFQKPIWKKNGISLSRS